MSALGNQMPRYRVRTKEPVRPWSSYFCLAEGISRGAGLFIAEYEERNKGIEVQGSGCMCIKRKGSKVNDKGDSPSYLGVGVTPVR